MNNAFAQPEKFSDFLDEIVGKAEQHNAHAAAALILMSRDFRVSEMGGKTYQDLDQQKALLRDAIRSLTKGFENAPLDLLSMRPAESFQSDALRAGLPHAETLDALTQPLVSGEHQLAAKKWTFLGAATWMDSHMHSVPMFSLLAKKAPEVFNKLRDPEALQRDLAEIANGAPLRGAHNPVNQWLPGFRDTNDRTHDVLDITVLAADTMQFFMPAHLMSKRSDNPEFAGGALALHAVRAHDILAMSGREQINTQVKHAANHISHVAAVALMHGAGVHLSQKSWENGEGIARARGLEFGYDAPKGVTADQTLAQPLVMAVLRHFSLADDKEIAKTIRQMDAHGHNVAATAPGVSKQEPPIFTAVQNSLPETTKALFDGGVETDLKHLGRTIAESVQGNAGSPNFLATKNVVAAAEALAMVGAKSNELKVPAGPSGPKPSWA